MGKRINDDFLFKYSKVKSKEHSLRSQGKGKPVTKDRTTVAVTLRMDTKKGISGRTGRVGC